MVVLRDPGEVYLLCHTGGDEAVSWVEQIDPQTLDIVRRSPDLPGGPTWPGGIAAHADGALYVAFGRYVHRLSSDLEVLTSVELPRRRPYNSFVVLGDGNVAVKDFAGNRPGHLDEYERRQASHLMVLEQGSLRVLDVIDLPEPSIARLSADGDDIYVVGDTSLMRVLWRDGRLALDEQFVARYRTMEGQGFGWDAVIADGAAWFMDNGSGTERYAGTFLGIGEHSAPLHLIRVDLSTAEVRMMQVCGLPGGIIANPPAVDPSRAIAVAYDSGNGVVAAFDYGPTGDMKPRWQRSLNHAAHPMLFTDDGLIAVLDHQPDQGGEHLVLVDIATGDERLRVATGSPVQSVLFMAPGHDRDIYVCSFTTISRIALD